MLEVQAYSTTTNTTTITTTTTSQRMIKCGGRDYFRRVYSRVDQYLITERLYYGQTAQSDWNLLNTIIIIVFPSFGNRSFSRVSTIDRRHSWCHSEWWLRLWGVYFDIISSLILIIYYKQQCQKPWFNVWQPEG